MVIHEVKVKCAESDQSKSQEPKEENGVMDAKELKRLKTKEKVARHRARQSVEKKDEEREKNRVRNSEPESKCIQG